MTVHYRVVCDGCGDKLAYDIADEKQDVGWLEVWSGEGESKDFCSQSCMIEFYTGEEEEE